MGGHGAMVGMLSIPPLGGCWTCWGGCPPHAPALWLRFSLLSLVVLGPEPSGSGHNCTELLGALQNRVPSAGCSFCWLPGFSPLGSERCFAVSPELLGSACDHPAWGLTWRLGSSSRKMKGLPKRRWRAAFVVSFSDLNFSCAKRCWT